MYNNKQLMRTKKQVIKQRYPTLWKTLRRFRYPTAPIPLSLWLINFVVQRIFRVNGDVPWMVNYTSRVTVPKRINIGKGVWVSFALSGGCYIQAMNGIIIGEGTIFAPGVKIISANHEMSDFSRWKITDPIEIGNNCWIGANAVILPGIKLGEGCIVGAGSVVTRSFPENCIVAGVPAKLIKERKILQQYE